MKCDVLIIGGGLAGCTCARLLAQSGLTVIVVERACLLDKDKLCGGLLTPRAQKTAERLFGQDIRNIYACMHTEMRVLIAAHDRTIGGVNVVGTKRKDLDQYILGKAREAGVIFYEKSRVITLDIPAGQAIVETSEGIQTEIIFNQLVAADGAASMTRKEACRQYNLIKPAAAREPRFARPCQAELVASIEAYIEPRGQALTGKYDAKLHGYGWYISCDETCNIGFDGACGTTRSQLRASLDTFAHEMGVSIDDNQLRGAFIPSGSTVLLQLGGPGVKAVSQDAWPHPVYFIGDAAGLAAPATGEGIFFALRSAEALAISLTRGVASYRSLMSGNAATLKRQYDMLDVLFNESLMETSMSFSHVSGVGPDRMARFALKLFASF